MHKCNQSKTGHNGMSNLLRTDLSWLRRGLKLAEEISLLLLILLFLYSMPTNFPLWA